MTQLSHIKELIEYEIIERGQEGCNIGSIKSRAAGACGVDELNSLYDELISLPVSKDFPYYEPETLEEILKASEGCVARKDAEINQGSFLGAWLGRCIGCALGKPLETSPFTGGRGGDAGWKFVHEWFKGADAYPISGYVPQHSAAEKTLGVRTDPGSAPSCKENIRFMQTDDDVRYMVLALIILEKYSADFSTRNVMDAWRQQLPVNLLFTAERQAYLNACEADEMFDETPEKYDYIRMHNNPFREWIGAQIRVDVYAYACAGNPQRAAELAYKDASFSHTKNGVYGAMFCAGMIAAAFTSHNVSEIIDAGLSVIPQNCRLYHAVKKACAIAAGAKNELELAEKINLEFSQYHPVHTINNAAICAAAIVYGNGDFEKSVTTAVLLGCDTDCNGATVGSVLGAVNTAGGIPEKWSMPLNDTLYSSIPGFHPIKISECAERTYRLYCKLR